MKKTSYIDLLGISLVGNIKIQRLIRDFKRLQFFHFLRLLEKGQDNISKRAAVEKEPSTLEKDKEDQSKYYFSYSRPPD